MRMRAGLRLSRRWYVPLLFILPAATLFLIFYLLPLVYAFYLSLFHQYGLHPAVYVRFANYVRALSDHAFLGSILNILEFLVVQGTAMILLALFFALYLDNRRNWFRGFFRLSFYLPFIIPSVISGILWGFLYSKSLSPILDILKVIGINMYPLSPSWLLWSVANIVMWEWTGYNMIILYTGLLAIPPTLYEAAQIDGASGLQVILKIKLPLLRPALMQPVELTSPPHS